MVNGRNLAVKILPYHIEVEHIGSTAVVALDGKGIIDLMIIANHWQQLPEITEILRNNGFDHNHEPKHTEDRFFVSGLFRYNEKELHIHIHITFGGVKSIKISCSFGIILDNIQKKLRLTLNSKNNGV